MLKMYSFFFGILQKIMFIVGLHWFFTAIIHLGTISSLALIGAVILVFLAYRYLENLKKQQSSDCCLTSNWTQNPQNKKVN